jgi:hypothetical protein
MAGLAGRVAGVEMGDEHKAEFDEWWSDVGSGTTRLPGEDMDEFAYRIAFRAYQACIDINNLEE